MEYNESEQLREATGKLTKHLPVVELVEEPLGRMARWWLSVTALCMAIVLGIAFWLHPRDDNGQPHLQGTHQQLGLPPCTLYYFTGWPCPGCGLTTSFCHFMHGDFANSLRANPMGTVLATLCLVLSPLFFLSAILGRRFGIQDYSDWSCRMVILLVAFLFVQWGVRLGLRGKLAVAHTIPDSTVHRGEEAGRVSRQ